MSKPQSINPFIAAQGKVKRGSPCSFVNIRARLDDERRQFLDDAIRDDTVGHATISGILFSDWQITVNPSTVSRHRRGLKGEPDGCRCDN